LSHPSQLYHCGFIEKFLNGNGSNRHLFPIILYINYRANAFELVGFDILIDSNFKVWLLEVNHTPSLSPHTELENKLKRVMIRDLLQLVDIENNNLKQISQEADRKFGYVCKYVLMKIFSLYIYIIKRE